MVGPDLASRGRKRWRVPMKRRRAFGWDQATAGLVSPVARIVYPIFEPTYDQGYGWRDCRGAIA